MQITGVYIETIHNPVSYSPQQVEQACRLAAALGRGKFVLVEPPQR